MNSEHKTTILTDKSNTDNSVKNAKNYNNSNNYKKDITKIGYISEDNKNILYPLNYIR